MESVKTSLSLAFLACLSATLAVPARSAQREEVVLLGEGRRVTIAVPSGFTFEQARDAAGLARAVLADAGRRVSLDLAFLPDPEGEAMRLRVRNERMVEFFQEHVAASVEKAMQFEELAPRRGTGTFCVFTDAALVGRTDLPPNEYRHLTAGVKAWAWVLVVFRLFSNDTSSEPYLAAMRALRETVDERPVPLR